MPATFVTIGTRAVLNKAVTQYGFLSGQDVAELAADDSTRLRQLLVRCQEGRFVAAAQDVADLVRAVEVGGWHVRDVSLLASDPIWQGVRR